MNNWIEFSKQKPPVDTLVFYYFEHTGVSLGEFEEPDTFFGKLGFLGGDVTHWMFADEFIKNAKKIEDHIIFPKYFVVISEDNDFNIGSAHRLASNELIFVNKWGKQIINPVKYCEIPKKPMI